MTPQELKNSILQLAIQGKLVEQRADEGTGAELLRDILTQRHRDAESAKKNLTRSRGARGGCEEGELFNLPKAVKSHPEKFSALSASPREEIPDDEKPFYIPESWEWVRLGEIGSWASGATPSRTHSEYYGGSIPWLKTGDLTDGYVSSIPEFITDLALEKNSVRLNPVGSVLMAMYGATIGKLGILQIAATTNQACCACIPYDGVWNKYLFYYLMARRKAFIKMGEGGAQPNISKEKIVNALIPLPPLAEQKRIVAKIEELLPLIDRYEKAWSKLEDFNKRFPADMQKSLLQMAIQGKLVEQRADEGTGAELLEKIFAARNAEDAKKNLTRSRGVRGGCESGELFNLPKAAKSHPEKFSALSASPRDKIPDDEIPFEIPESWEWVRWGDLSQSIQYGYNASAKKAGRIKMVRISDIQGGQVLWDTVPYCEINEKDIETYLLQKNDILFARTGGTVGKSFLVKDLPVDAVYAGYLIRTRYSSELSPEYMKYFMESPLYWEQLKNGTIATAQPNCNGKTLARMLIPLPPPCEQKRIVAKLEELLPLCERLKAKSGELSQPELSKRSEV